MHITLAAMVGLATISTASLAAPTPSNAQVYPWCAHYSRDWGTNCGFVSLQQCLATVSGIGGYCAENPFYRGAAASDRRPRKGRQDQGRRY
jgi:hypothetical protein